MNDERETPQEFFDILDNIFHFELDAAASNQNTKVLNCYTIEYSGLTYTWANVTWVNPPYSKGQIIKWVRKAAHENVKTVMLLPGDSSTNWFHLLREVAKIYFIKGRLSFGEKSPAKFPSILGLWNVTQTELIKLGNVIPGWWV